MGGGNKKILKQVYTSTVRPHLEYASTSWSTAAKSNCKHIKIEQVQDAEITVGMRTTPITAMEKATDLQSLEEKI